MNPPGPHGRSSERQSRGLTQRIQDSGYGNLTLWEKDCPPRYILLCTIVSLPQHVFVSVQTSCVDISDAFCSVVLRSILAEHITKAAKRSAITSVETS